MKKTIKGTPFQAGSNVFIDVVMPCLKAVDGRPQQEIEHFYAGMISALMGSMVADFGHEKTLLILQTLVDQLQLTNPELSATTCH